MDNLIQTFKEYIADILKAQDGTEHTGRTPLQNLLNKLKRKNVSIEHEPKRGEKGAPDFKFSLNGIPIGYLENKKIGEDLDKTLKTDQIEKYKKLNNNLIITDYLRWIWVYENNTMMDITLCSKEELQKPNKIDKEKYQELKQLIEDFTSKEPEEITKANKLAEALARPTKVIREEIEREIKNKNETSENAKLQGLFGVFKEYISENIKEKEFADAFAQTFTYSLFLTKLNLKNPSEKLTINNIFDHTPKSFALIRDILNNINILKELPKLKHPIDAILAIINCTNSHELAKDLKFTEDEIKDPYIHFYEDFLKSYDPKTRVDAGVYYTPEPVVRAIVQNIQGILEKDFNIAEGLGDKTVKVLDFACGTGTFLLEVYKQILTQTKSTKRKNIIEKHILENIYGFELLIPAYCVSHLKLSQYLKEETDYELEANERIKVYLTNTLEKNDKETTGGLGSFLPEIAKEGKEAQKIKDDKEILVITGNPPYNVGSQNKSDYIKDLIKPYFPANNEREKKMGNINDDYVKFIRFAESKIEESGKGIVGIITNHSFINRATFRTMREHLMKTFDKIYIIDLHGNINKKEKCPDESVDQNVFDIQQGVSISFFVKHKDIKNKKDAEVYRLDIFGKRTPKFKQISEIDLQKTNFTKIEPDEPNFLFIPQNKKLRNRYNKFTDLKDIFIKQSSGMQTYKDEFAIGFNEEEFKEKLQDFKSLSEDEAQIKYNLDKDSKNWKVANAQKEVKEDKGKYTTIAYRPFDTRYTYFTGKSGGFHARPRGAIMKHMLQSNIGLIFTRQINGNFSNVFISNTIVDYHICGDTYVAPLYLYQNTIGAQTKEVNFESQFRELVNAKFGNPSPECVLGYIYAVLHSPSYRTKYLEFLQIDYPKIPFCVSIDEFKKLSALGKELIDAHLMVKVPSSSVGASSFDKEENHIVQKIFYNEGQKRLYVNESLYFEGVSSEIWEFKIGSHKVLNKYLKERKKMDISNDIEHIEKTIQALDFTIKQMNKIDEVWSTIDFEGSADNSC